MQGERQAGRPHLLVHLLPCVRVDRLRKLLLDARGARGCTARAWQRHAEREVFGTGAACRLQVPPMECRGRVEAAMRAHLACTRVGVASSHVVSSHQPHVFHCMYPAQGAGCWPPTSQSTHARAACVSCIVDACMLHELSPCAQQAPLATCPGCLAETTCTHAPSVGCAGLGFCCVRFWGAKPLRRVFSTFVDSVHASLSAC